jgi:hypothetical protein
MTTKRSDPLLPRTMSSLSVRLSMCSCMSWFRSFAASSSFVRSASLA